MEINELFGTLQQSVVSTWRKHLEAKSLSKHEVLDEYYKDMPEKIDKLIEDWQGVHGKVEHYKNILDIKEYNVKDYLKQLRKICRDSRSILDKDELKGDMDDIISFIDQILYKLEELVKESKSLVEYITEALNNTARYYINVSDLADKEKTKRLQFDDQHWDSKDSLFLTPDGILYAQTEYEFNQFSKVLKALNWDGEEVKGIASPASYGKKLVGGDKLYKKLKQGQYKLIGDKYPFANTYKIKK